MSLDTYHQDTPSALPPFSATAKMCDHALKMIMISRRNGGGDDDGDTKHQVMRG